MKFDHFSKIIRYLSDNVGALVRSCSLLVTSTRIEVLSLSLLPSVLASVRLLDKKNCVMLFKSGDETVSARSGNCDLRDSMSFTVN